MPGMEWAWLIPALSFIAFALIVAFGRWLPGRGAFIAVLAIGAGFVLFWPVMVDLVRTGLPGEPGQYGFSWTWFPVGDTRLTWGMIVDPLSVLMLGIVTLVALGVQVYSLEYMRGEPRYGWYFAAHALFAASMLTLVLADNFILLYIVWELVGLCSYLLIGFWFERRSAAEAAKKAFVTTRIGDVGLLVGILLLFKVTGTFQMSAIFAEAAKLAAGEPSLLSSGTATAAAILIFVGAMGKSAQFPLHVWLPDAMEGPSPVSALIHAATMVVAGVFLVARAFPLFDAAPTAVLIVAVVGLITAVLAATMALVVTDLKRILAYSTVTDLGLMMLSLGAFGVTAAMFHLLAHAFAKAMLFLGAGSVMHGMHEPGDVDIRKAGGLWRRMPLTALTFGIGALALAGVPPLSGFFSKDEIFGALWSHRPAVFVLLFLVVAFLKAVYLSRAWLAVFSGPLKRENEHVHESPLAMTLPLLVMGALTLVLGFLAIGWTADYQGFGTFVFFHEAEAFHFNLGLAAVSVVVAVGGLAVAWATYVTGRISAASVQRRVAPLHRLVASKYYMDDLYQWVINKLVLAFSGLVAWFDRVVVNDGGVNGTAESVRSSGLRLRYHVSGKMYNYALGMALGAVAVILLWWLVAPV
ncbi:MAG: NADH-quinone oxidoreductase subunit L [Chloroflexi bacterium]|nr:NADH-quinone oxidoreductase subunit L [Chloroflexota bacterium]